MSSDTLVSEVKRHLYVHDLDAETLRYLGDALWDHANSVYADEEEGGAKKMKHANSTMLFLWSERFRTDANRLEDKHGKEA